MSAAIASSTICKCNARRIVHHIVDVTLPWTRDGHGIPKCCPCPSVLFLMLPGPSVRFRVFFLGGEYVCPSYGPLKFLKLAKLGQKSVRPFVK